MSSTTQGEKALKGRRGREVRRWVVALAPYAAAAAAAYSAYASRR